MSNALIIICVRIYMKKITISILLIVITLLTSCQSMPEKTEEEIKIELEKYQYEIEKYTEDLYEIEKQYSKYLIEMEQYNIQLEKK